MMTVQPISVRKAHTFIRTYQLSHFMNKGYEGTKYEFCYRGKEYEWYGVFNEEGEMVAVQVTWHPIGRDIYLECLQKRPGTEKGVFKVVMDYFSEYTMHFKAYADKLQKMYKKLGFRQIDEFEFVK